jgi:hypothetical protein
VLAVSHPNTTVHNDNVDDKKERVEVDRKLVKFTEQLAKYTGVLVLVGILQAIVLFVQACILKHHSRHLSSLAKAAGNNAQAAKANAKAAKISAQVAMGVSVPRLRVSQFTLAPTGAANLEAIFQYPNIKILVKNYGQSPAFLKMYSVNFTCEDLPYDPAYTVVKSFEAKDVVEPDGVFALGNGSVRPERLISPENTTALVEGTKFLTIYGYVRYGDVFGSPDWYLRFCETLLEINRDGTNPLFAESEDEKYTSG